MANPAYRPRTPRWLLAPLGLAALIGCTSPLDVELSVVVSEAIPTVVTVTWEPEHPAADPMRIELGSGPTLDREFTALPTDDGKCRATLVGLKPSTTYRLRAVEIDGGTTYASDRLTVETGPAPAGMPGLTVERTPGRSPAGGFLVTSLLSNPSWAVIIDEDGDYVWWHTPGDEWERSFVPRAHLSADGAHVLYEASASALTGEDDSVTGERMLVRVSLDGTEVDTVSLEGCHHDFVELPGGNVAAIVSDVREVDGEEVEGDRIVELDWDGVEQGSWSAWDHIEYDPADVTADDDPGWTHANALDHDPADDSYTLSLRNQDTILRIDRASGEIRWRLGGVHNDFDAALNVLPLFQRQHQFQRLDSSILVFDNGTVDDMRSRAVEYALDEGNMTAQQIWTHVDDPPLFSIGFGDVTRLPSDHTLVTWSSAGQIDEVTEDGVLVWRMNAAMGAGFGYTVWAAAPVD